ncbi:hypothetical protein F5876DRAFT_66436 [Lentinula aff. lateritia]|uniref:Uncharacterized protein n=1 Tax=Lentinula aff. lateritia TaxID=2804960 RepID=A0ACC1TXW0_9AGAR|nr:hypothetical protein F5876DRAFT_66436 [Lentinula aff. lateritia]
MQALWDLQFSGILLFTVFVLSRFKLQPPYKQAEVLNGYKTLPESTLRAFHRPVTPLREVQISVQVSTFRNNIIHSLSSAAQAQHMNLLLIIIKIIAYQEGFGVGYIHENLIFKVHVRDYSIHDPTRKPCNKTT